MSEYSSLSQTSPADSGTNSNPVAAAPQITKLQPVFDAVEDADEQARVNLLQSLTLAKVEQENLMMRVRKR